MTTPPSPTPAFEDAAKPENPSSENAARLVASYLSALRNAETPQGRMDAIDSLCTVARNQPGTADTVIRHLQTYLPHERHPTARCHLIRRMTQIALDHPALLAQPLQNFLRKECASPGYGNEARKEMFDAILSLGRAAPPAISTADNPQPGASAVA